MFVDNGRIACKTHYEWCKTTKKCPYYCSVVTFPMLHQKLEATSKLGNKTEQNVNLLNFRPNKQIHAQVNHHCVATLGL
jgi:hypothetical protein